MRRLIVVMAILGVAHSAHAHGIAGNRFFPGTLSFDDPAVADESILPLFSSSQMKGVMSSIRGLVGLFFAYSLQRSELASIADGFTAIGAACGVRGSIQPILRSRARFTGTTCTRRWCRRDWAGGSATRARKEPAPTRPI